MNDEFPFRRLKVWKKSVELFESVCMEIEANKKIKSYRLIEQLYACSSSVSMNIAEGAGRYSNKEFAHYLYISRGSLFEMLTLLEIFVNMKIISQESFREINDKSFEVLKMLNKLISSIKSNK